MHQCSGWVKVLTAWSARLADSGSRVLHVETKQVENWYYDFD